MANNKQQQDLEDIFGKPEGLAQTAPDASSSDQDALKEIFGKPEGTPDPSAWEAFSRGALHGLPFLQPAAAATEAAVESLSGNKPFLDTYRADRDALENKYEQAASAHPVASVLGNVAGSLPLGAATGGLGEALAGENLAAKAVMASPVVQGALGAGLMGASDSKADLTKGEFGQFAKDTGESALTGGAIGGAFQAAAPVIGKAAKMAGKAGLQSILGVAPEDAARYLENPDAVNTQRPFEEVRDDLLDTVNAKRAAVDAAQQEADNASDALKQANQDARIQNREDILDTRDQIRGLQDQRSDALDNTVSELQNQVPHPRNLTGDVVAAIGQLKNQALDAEDRATQTLVDQGVKIPTQDLIDHLQGLIEKYSIGAKKNIAADQASVAELKNLLGKVQELHGQALEEAQNAAGTNLGDIIPSQNPVDPSTVSLPARDARTFLKSLNQQIKFNNAPGEFMGYGSRGANDFRAYLNNYLKSQSPQYAKIMETQAAPAFELLDHLNSAFGYGDPGKTSRALEGIINPTNGIKRDLLTHLGNYTGNDFETPISQYEQMQNILADKTPLEQGLPQTSQIENLQSQLSTLQSPSARQDAIDALNTSSPEAQALQAAQSKLDQANSALEPYSRINENSAQGILNSAKTGRSINNEDILGQLSQETGKDFVGEMKNLKAQQAFQPRQWNPSSRRSFLGAMVGTGVGSLFGSPKFGAVTGAAVGGLTDTYGGVIAKKALDTGLFLQNALQKTPEVLGPYAAPLAAAAARGSEALAATHYVLSQNSPEYRELIAKHQAQSQ